MKKNDSTMTQQEKDLYELLYSKHGTSLNIETTSVVINKSPSTLYRMRKDKIGPGYIQDEIRADNSAIRYPLHEVVRYLCNNKGGENYV